MGVYLNPENGQDKEEWLEQNGLEIAGIPSVKEAQKWLSRKRLVFICLVDNGAFTAAAVGFDYRVLEDFKDPQDMRRKRFFMVDYEDVYNNSDLKDYDFDLGGAAE